MSGKTNLEKGVKLAFWFETFYMARSGVAMLIEILSHLMNFDIGWFVALLADNLLMAFMLFAVFAIFLEGQNILKGSLVIFITLFAFLDFEKVLGVTFFTGSFMLIYYISKLSVLAIAEGIPSLKSKMIFINELQFYAALAGSLVFMG